MPIPKIIEKRVHRELDLMVNYRNVANVDANIRALFREPLPSGEELIGVYENYPGESKEVIFLASHGLYLLSGANWEFIGYQEITKISLAYNQDFPSTRSIPAIVDYKLSVDRLILQLSNKSVELPVRGGKLNKSRDVYTFSGVLNRLISHEKS